MAQPLCRSRVQRVPTNSTRRECVSSMLSCKIDKTHSNRLQDAVRPKLETAQRVLYCTEQAVAKITDAFLYVDLQGSSSKHGAYQYMTQVVHHARHGSSAYRNPRKVYTKGAHAVQIEHTKAQSLTRKLNVRARPLSPHSQLLTICGRFQPSNSMQVLSFPTVQQHASPLVSNRPTACKSCQQHQTDHCASCVCCRCSAAVMPRHLSQPICKHTHHPTVPSTPLPHTPCCTMPSPSGFHIVSRGCHSTFLAALQPLCRLQLG